MQAIDKQNLGISVDSPVMSTKIYVDFLRGSITIFSDKKIPSFAFRALLEMKINFVRILYPTLHKKISP